MKYSVILTNVGSCCDRFLPGGYSRAYSTKELFERLSHVPGVEGTELISGYVITLDNMEILKGLLKQYKLSVSCVIPDHFGKTQWSRGAFTSPDVATRHAAVEETCRMADFARQVGCGIINIWNGQDGHDYPLQADYNAMQRHLVEGCPRFSRIRTGAKVFAGIQAKGTAHA